MATIAFYMQLYRDGVIAHSALRHVRRAYPDARVILQSDGDETDYDALASAFDCAYFPGRRLYGREAGGKMLQRMLNDYLCGSGDYLIKIDTDTRIDRPFNVLPTEHAVYGHLLRQGAPQGGCVIIPRAVARELRDSRIFLDNQLRGAGDSWGALMQPSFLREQLERCDRIGFEWTLLWGCQQLRIPVLRHAEIHATWKEGHLNTDQHYAVVHPDKFLEVEDQLVHDHCTVTHAQASDMYLKAIYNASV